MISMNIEVGSVVKSLAGKDKDRFFCVVGFTGDGKAYCLLRDGKLFKVEKPKKKNVKHINATGFKLQSEALQVNKHLKKAIDSLMNN